MKSKVIIGKCEDALKQFPEESFDCIVTDPPYGIKFMNKKWDKALPSIDALKECCRVLKAGAFGFFMCSPRMDVLWRMGQRLEEAGFRVDFSFIAWSFAQGFPKAQNISKAIDHRLGAEREVISGISKPKEYSGKFDLRSSTSRPRDTGAVTPEAKRFDGSYSGFQPKPALEVIIVAMKPLSEKTYVDQALQNGHGITWLGNCKIPFECETDIPKVDRSKFHVDKNGNYTSNDYGKYKAGTEYKPDYGRFPANLLVSDNILDQGIIHKSGILKPEYDLSKTENGDIPQAVYGARKRIPQNFPGDSGDFSRYFSLDAWFSKKMDELPEEQQKTFPFLITPKPSKSEKNRYIENHHPTVKPLKLMSYLITLGSREGDLILDPFAGSGTTLEACKLLNRTFVGIDMNPENESLMRARGQLDPILKN